MDSSSRTTYTNIDELASQNFVFTEEGTGIIREQLHPSVNSFLDSIYSSAPGFFDRVDDISVQLVDEIFPDQHNGLKRLARRAGKVPTANWALVLASMFS